MVYARAYTLLVALFFGGTTALSFLAVPMLFAYMDVPQLAGALAAILPSDFRQKEYFLNTYF